MSQTHPITDVTLRLAQWHCTTGPGQPCRFMDGQGGAKRCRMFDVDLKDYGWLRAARSAECVAKFGIDSEEQTP